MNQAVYPLVLQDVTPYHLYYCEEKAKKYIKEIINDTDYILELYKSFSEKYDFIDAKKQHRIKKLAEKILGKDVYEIH